MQQTDPILHFSALSVIAICVIAALLLLVVVIVVLALRIRRKSSAPPVQDLSIDIRALGTGGPRADGPRLEFYGTPVRLAALVLAPAGRNSQIPEKADLPDVMEYLLPGIMQVLNTDRPAFFTWPMQLSTQGFAHAFFNNAALPGDHGKGTEWCAVAGRFEAGDQQLLAGLICSADKPNSLSQVTVQHAGMWMDVLRAKGIG